MRLFIAVSFPAPLREQLRQAAGRLQGQCLRGRFTLTDNFHLTLAFLGETERRAAAAYIFTFDINNARFNLTVVR